ncbi:hypothetical protein ABCS02_16790 [Microbacterium sp. X-17]|uniref:RCC1 domain-containing protein n=1 Tax=Microbacterium sp. X-17 TaxID=3144404 RepID=UPI0031F50049
MNTPSKPSASPSRRTIVKGAAWAMPAVALSVASPAAATSLPPVTVLTVRFTQPLYTTTQGGQFLTPVVAATVWDAKGPVADSSVTFVIAPVEISDGSETEEGDDEPDGSDVVAAFGRLGGAPANTVTSSATGLATPEVIFAGDVAGVLRVTATALVNRGGTVESASAEAFIRISAVTTTIVPLSAGYRGTSALGAGSNTNNPIPAAVALPSSAPDITLLGAGLYRSGFALDASGTVWGWGSDLYRTQAVRRTQPIPVPFTGMPSDIVQLEGTYYAMFALTRSGEVWGWGYNREGQFADGTTAATYRETPVRIPNLGPVKKLAGGHYNMHALLEDGTLVNWGYGRYGSLGDGITTVHRVTTPTRVTGFPADRTVVDVAGRYDGASAVLDDGSVWSWGSNGEGQIGDGTVARRYVPTQVTSLTDAKRVYANYWNVGVVLADGTCRLWGNAGYYNLGNGSTTDPRVPVDPGLTNVDALSWGLQTGHALLTDGSVYGWGYNGNYETGTGVRGNIKVPLRVPGIGPVKQIAQSQYSTYFLPR